MSLLNPMVIIADDLTGANDTALQFFKKGYSSKIIINYQQEFEEIDSVDVWAISTESRNIEKFEAIDKVALINQTLKEKLNTDNFYKKIDSTLRGNTGVEIVAMLEATGKDAAIIAPAYIEEGRTTIGSYQLLNSVPIERTQVALDPKSPINDSYIPNILKKDLNSHFEDIIGSVDFQTIVKGAGPIVLKINELIQKGKKLIVMDAVNKTDLEQITLAINKSSYNLLPCGSAGLANAISENMGENHVQENIKHIKNHARLIVSGSATKLSANQIAKLKENRPEIYAIDLTIKDIVEDSREEIIDKVVEKLSQNQDVLIHSSNINKEIKKEEAQDALIDAEIEKKELPTKITDFLSDLLQEINAKSEFILILVGGETSYKCVQKINSNSLEILDAILPAIPLCIDSNGKIITTKSGNFGVQTTLCDILEYFDKFKNE